MLPPAAPTPSDDFNAPQSIEPQLVIPVIEEQLRVGTEVVETGRVRVTKQVHEEHHDITAPTVREEIEVQRVPINQYVDVAPPAVRQEGDTTIMPVLREVLVVEKRILFVEEVRITKRQVHAETTQPVTLRQEEIIVERVSGATPPPAGSGISA
ncbi:YsnF/AvaK domain-containing protein [Hymenobacter sp. CRA2]|uniref:YsnF/AvaK domain-containing protein n=1 Tax=Hymenobacter sp. CRA2 TaxID=1955620 RepID=UPI00098F9165|nr:YsnF/AvaK domain-containing protein [Hymenobacter sp. CRA2]OON68659.1 hypothetical protein B0919_12620 [Hymenobacter sp. CRA2]